MTKKEIWIQVTEMCFLSTVVALVRIKSLDLKRRRRVESLCFFFHKKQDMILDMCLGCLQITTCLGDNRAHPSGRRPHYRSRTSGELMPAYFPRPRNTTGSLVWSWKVFLKSGTSEICCLALRHHN